MSKQIVAQTDQATQAKPKPVSGVAWSMGFEDGQAGKSIYSGYHIFSGKKLVDYKAGWQAARKLKAM